MNFAARIALLLVLSSLLLGPPAFSQPEEKGDRTLSPYFFVKSDDPKTDQLPLKSTSADVRISGVIADVRVTQVYKNEGARPLEAAYIFPASTRAAVYGMKMIIGERVIEARVGKREEARREYEQARREGKSASLLEQQRPNVFQMNVANILPGDQIRVELQYTELLVPTDKVYEFVYPTVAGPRYTNLTAETLPPSETWVRNPYLPQGEAPSCAFDIRVELAAGMPIRELRSPSHKVGARFDGPSFAAVGLDPSEISGGNRDYILRYRLDGEKIQSGLLLHRGQRENFFLLMMQPPRKMEKTSLLPREYIFIVDVSGSMHGFPLEISKKLMKDLFANLRPADRFNVLLFSGGSAIMAGESLPATSGNIRQAVSLIERQRGGGGTELLPALGRALKLKKPEGYSRTVVIATDGYVRVEEEVFDLIREHLGEANLFAFGIGTAVNRHIIEGMARVGMGEPLVITRPEEAPAKAAHFRSLIQSPMLTGVKVNFDGFQAYDVEPLAVPDVLAERPAIVFGKWRGDARGKIALSGIAGNGKYSEVIDVGRYKPAAENKALRFLWARHRIALLSDYNHLRRDERRVKDVTDLGLAYNLLTAYTSFVAIDTQVRNQTGEVVTVKQPLPLPQGVSDYAIGGLKMSHAPAPSLARSKAPMETAEKGRREQGDQRNAARNRIRLEELSVTGGLSQEEVGRIVRRKVEELAGELGAIDTAGKLVVKLMLTPEGKVRSVKIVSNSLKESRLEQRIIDRIKKWLLPAGAGEASVTVRLAFGNL